MNTRPKPQQQYLVTITFIGGNLEGITITERRSFPLKVGTVVKPILTSGAYRVDACVAVTK